MSKILFITDLHFGVHSNSPQFLDYQERFFKDQLFPFIKENKIKTIFCLGDEFENRKVVNFYSLSRSKEMFFDPIERLGIDLKIIVGNHSMFLKDNLDINSPKLLFDRYKKFEIIDDCVEHDFDGCKFLSVPWITPYNKENILSHISNTKAKYLLGHFEVSDLKLHKNWQFYKGVEHKVLDKFERVLSGHYHLRLNKKNFSYIGTPYQSSWEDLYEEKGFEVFDTQTNEFTYYKNPLKIYNSIQYKDDIDLEKFNFNEYSNSFIRLFLTKVPEDYGKYDIFVKKLSEHCHSCSVIESFFDEVKKTIDNKRDKDIKEEKEESTLESIHRKCESVSDVIDSETLFNYLHLKYDEAQEMMEL